MPILQPIPIPTKNRCFFARILVWLVESRKWKLVKKYRYKMRDGTVLVIPKGFEFDGASIPRPLWPLLSPTGLFLIPSLFHDYAYKKRLSIYRQAQEKAQKIKLLPKEGP